MPELPEVSVVINYLKKNIVGKHVKNFVSLKEKMIKNATQEQIKTKLFNQKLTQIRRRGKYILIDFEKNTLVIHLRMEGKLRLENKNTYEILKHDYFMISFEDDILVYNDVRMFGTFEFVELKKETELKGIKKLGLEYSDKKLTPSYLLQKCKNRKQSIKTKLLTQEIFTGLGNIYVDEVLFASKINPLTPAGKINLKQAQDIIEFSIKIMEKSIKYGGSSIKSYTSGKNQKGSYQQFLKVYGRVDLDCLVCKKSKITKTKINGRGTYYCPNCQKEF